MIFLRANWSSLLASGLLRWVLLGCTLLTRQPSPPWISIHSLWSLPTASWMSRIGPAIITWAAFDTIAGATQVAGDYTPNPGQTGQPLSGIYIIWGLTQAQSYTYDPAEIPPGLHVYPDLAANEPISGTLVNYPRFILKGIPRTPGEYYSTLTAYKLKDGIGGEYTPIQSTFFIDILGEPVPFDPLDFKLTPQPHSLDLSWLPAEQTSAYRLYRGLTDAADTAQLVDELSAEITTYRDETVERGKLYYYWLQAVNDTGQSGLVGPVPGELLPPPSPIAPDVVQSSDGTSPDSIRISWSGVAYAESYQVWRAVVPDRTSAILLDTVIEPTYLDENLPPATSFWYWIRAVNPTGTSEFSPFTEGRTAARPLPPPYYRSPFETPDGFVLNGLGYLYQGYFPFIYSFNYGNWWYVFPFGAEDNEGWYCYDFALQQFGYSAPDYYPYYYSLGDNSGQAINLNP